MRGKSASGGRTEHKPPLVVVSGGLGLDGGGSAVVGRLTLSVVARYAAAHGLSVEALDLGGSIDLQLPCPVRHFAGRQLRLALAAWLMQIRGPKPRLLFDCPGPARTQAFMPAVARAPYLVWMLGIEVWRPLSGQRRRALEHATVRLAISRHTSQRARWLSPWLPPIDVVPLGLENRPIAGRVDRSVLEQAGEGYLLIVGRMASRERYKGHDELLEAFPAVAEGMERARLVVAGGGDDLERLRGSASERGLSEQVLFTGFVSEATLGALYDKCAALVMPSRNEGFGMVYLEAMRAGRAVLALRGGAAEEVVQDDVTGLLVDPDDGQALVRALRALQTDRELRDRLGAAGRRVFEERFTFSAFEQRLLPYLGTLLGSGRQRVRD